MAQSEAYNSVTGQRPKYSGFMSLQADPMEIRLLLLEPGASSESLRYGIRHAKLRSSTKYCALSYSWGAPVPVSSLREIFICGESVWIRPTLYSFLESLAFHSPETSWWIDAICINQYNVDECNHQVSLMREIYKTAQEVYVWLGIGDDDTNYAIEHIEDSQTQTRFDQETFSNCVEKLFQASYWTRRWVIQEFALAEELTIVCGRRLTKWQKLVKAVDDKIHDREASAERRFENFKRVRLLGSEERISLFELMLQFRDACCIDRRDRVFALRGIAEDGHLILPRYDETVADAYFGVLSILPTERVLPKTIGYRWPHEAACQLQSCMQLTKKDVLGSLMSRATDRLYTVFEFSGVISAVQELPQRPPLRRATSKANKFLAFPLKVRLKGWNTVLFRGSKGLKSGDLIYSLQSTSRSPKGLYLVFRPSSIVNNVVGMLIDEPDNESISSWATAGLTEEDIILIKNNILGSVLKCSRNNPAISLQRRILCHINRTAFVLLWLLDLGEVGCLWNDKKEPLEDYTQISLRCKCLEDNEEPPQVCSNVAEQQKNFVEVLPSFNFTESQTFWSMQDTLPWTDASNRSEKNQDLSQEQIQIRKETKIQRPHVDFDRFSGTGLALAAFEGLFIFIEHLISMGDVQINYPDPFGYTPLFLAALEGHEKVVQMLLEKGATLDGIILIQDPTDESVMIEYKIIPLVADRGHEKVIRLLSNNGADVNANCGAPGTALQIASRKGNKEILQILLDHGADVNATCGKHGGPVSPTAYSGNFKTSKMLLEKGAYVNAPAEGQTNCYGTALYAAAAKGHENLVRLLLQHGADVKARSGFYDSTALEAAAANGYENVVQLLVEHGPNGKGEDDFLHGIHLHTAAANGHDKVVQLLLDYGMNPTAGGGFEQSPHCLEAAAANGHDKVVQLLLDRLETNHPYMYSLRTAVKAASANGHGKALQLLLVRRSKVKPPYDFDLRSTLKVAAKNGHDKAVQLLLDHRPDMNDPFVALQVAAANGHDKVVQVILEHASTPRNIFHSAALGEATKNGHHKVVKLLQDHRAVVNARSPHYLSTP